MKALLYLFAAAALAVWATAAGAQSTEDTPPRTPSVEEARPAVLPTLPAAAIPAQPAAPVLAPVAMPGGVVIRAGDFSRLYLFYADVLGLRVVGGGPEAPTAVFDAGGARLVLAHGGKDWDKPQAMRFLFPADSLEDRLTALQRVGVHAEEARDSGGALVAVYFADPESNPLGFVAVTSDPLTWARPIDLESLDRRSVAGRLPLMVFGGLYGLWLGAAIPSAAGVDEDAVYGLGILLGVPAGVAGAYLISDHNMTEGRAGVIGWSGLFGTWQGLGWAGEGNADDSGILWSGILGGLGAIAASTVITQDMYISRGQSTVMTSASLWGGWYGVVVGEQLDGEYDDFPLAGSLLGSAAGFAGGILWAASGNDIERRRANLINLAGFGGAAVGLGTAVLTGVEGDGALVMTGAGSLGGKVLATLLTVPSQHSSGAIPEDDSPHLVGVFPSYAPHRGAGLELRLGF